jgi:hypothetical protein
VKFLILILFPFFSFAQQSTYKPGDSVWITSWDTTRVKVYKTFLGGRDYALSNGVELAQVYDRIHIAPPKYDTIGPSWHQISDTTAGYNPIMAMQLYEVRIYTTEVEGRKDGAPFPFPHHFQWLDIKKKPFKLVVWADKIIEP